jgi:hypothetical protein
MMTTMSGSRLATEKRREKNMTIEERIESLELQLERSRKRFYWLCVGMGLCFAAALMVWIAGQGVTAAQTPAGKLGEVHASKFILEDQTGIQRAVLAVDKNGVALELVDETDAVRAHLMVIKEGPVLNLRDRAGRPRVQLAALSDNSMAGISLYNENGVSLAQLNLTRGGYPALTLFGNDAKPRIVLGVTPTGPTMIAYDQQGKAIWSAIK